MPKADDLVVSSEPDANPADVGQVRRGLHGYNAHETGLEAQQLVNLFVRDKAGEIRGGLLGYRWGGWLHLTHLWVAEPYRGRGLGRRLLETAEQEAMDTGAQGCFATAFDFQSPDFYRRLGYEVYAELPDYPPGHTTYHLRKWLGGR